MTEAADDIAMWMGRKVDDMSYAELRNAFTQLARMYRAAQAATSPRQQIMNGQRDYVGWGGPR